MAPSTTQNNLQALSSSSSKTKHQDQKAIQEKIAKVREVVKNASTNDVVLALHNFDMNVEQTIHAFCEGGFDLALGDWEKTSGGGRNKKKNKNGGTGTNKAKAPAATAAAKSGTNGSGSKTTASSTTGTLTLGASPSISSSLSSGVNFVIPVVPPPAPMAMVAAVNGGGPQKGGLSKMVAETTANKKATTNSNNMDGRLPFNAATTEAAIPIPPLSNAALLADCFKGIRDVLDMRERFLASELADAQQSGGGPVRLVCDNSTAISAIVQLGEVVKHGAGALPFHSTKGPSAKVIPATAAIVQNGQSAEIKPAPQKRPNSPSGGSQVSSVGEADSGIGQVSPVHQVNATAKKNVMAQVKQDGIGIESDAFSVDELAALQRNIMEQLKAKGIDPSFLAHMPAGAPPLRRRPPPSHGGGGKDGGSGRSGKPNNDNKTGSGGGKPHQRNGPPNGGGGSGGGGKEKGGGSGKKQQPPLSQKGGAQ